MRASRERDPASFWPGKRYSRRHSTTDFRSNVVVTETSYQRLEVFFILHPGEGLNLLRKLLRFNQKRTSSLNSAILALSHPVSGVNLAISALFDFNISLEFLHFFHLPGQIW